MKYPELMKECITRWGRDAQMFLLVEECGELLQAISKVRREDTAQTRENLQEEVADVLIMLWQAIEIYHLDGVQEVIDKKQDRLLQRLQEWEQRDLSLAE